LWAEGGVARVWIFRDSIVRGKNRKIILWSTSTSSCQSAWCSS
jgi:hypothetical protein